MKETVLKVFSGFLLQEIRKLDEKFYDFPVTLVCCDGNFVISSFLLAAISPFLKEILQITDSLGEEVILILTEFDLQIREIKSFLDIATEFRHFDNPVSIEHSCWNVFCRVCRIFGVNLNDDKQLVNRNSKEGSSKEIDLVESSVAVEHVAMGELNIDKSGLLFSCSNCNFTSDSINDVSDHMEAIHTEIEGTSFNVVSEMSNSKFQNESKLDILNSINEPEENAIPCVLSSASVDIESLKPETKIESKIGKHVLLENQDNEVRTLKNEEIVIINSKELTRLEDDSGITCKICDNKLSSIYTLKRHMAVHNKDKPYNCNLCSKSFTQKVVLNEHILMHSGEKRYACNICQKSFQQNNHLKYHMLSAHDMGSRHTCNQCGKVFTFRHQLTSHTAKHHGDLATGCLTCADCPDRVFMTNTKYNMHRETFHQHSNSKKNKQCIASTVEKVPTDDRNTKGRKLSIKNW